MENILLIVNIILATILVCLVLFQKSEGGALGIGTTQDSYISSRSASNFLTKATAIIATLFIITSISLTLLGKEAVNTISVIEKVEEKQESTEPEIPKSD